jgi:hypothetical protein
MMNLAPSPLRKYLLVVAVILLAIASLYLVLPLLGYSRPGSETIIYGLMVFYNATKLLIPVAILLLFLISLAIRARLVATRSSNILVTASLALLFCASLVGCLGGYASIWEGYQHLEATEFNGQKYMLGKEFTFEEASYMLCECDQLGLLCRCRDLAPALGSHNPPRFVIDPATNILSVRLGTGTVYELEP